MKYYKLIALEIDDLFSTIFFEQNYPLSEYEKARQKKEELEQNGYVCLLAKTISGITT
jgi:hypothetical protein